MACKYYGNCERQTGWCRTNTVLATCVWGLRRAYEEKKAENIQLQQDNDKLRYLLKLAVEDIEHMSCIENICEVCINNPQMCAIADTCYFEWEHADEAKGMIKNEP